MRDAAPSWPQVHGPRPPGPDRRTVYLHPGEVFASVEPCTVTTVLGTCVSVCLFDPAAGVGALNHYVLPLPAAEGETSGRFAHIAMRQLLAAVRVHGAGSQLRAKVFGGMVSAFSQASDLGTRNVSCALLALEEHGVPVVAMDVGGARGRKLVYETDTGEAWVKQL